MSLGKRYELIVEGEPVPKSTQRPPRGPKAYWVVQNYPKYERLKRTWAYQRLVADSALAQGLPRFMPDDPIRLSADIYKSGHKTGDTKNIIAAIEDGLQYGGFIPNDRQVTSYGSIRVFFGMGEQRACVKITLELDPLISDSDWLRSWLGSKRKAQAYLESCNELVGGGLGG